MPTPGTNSDNPTHLDIKDRPPQLRSEIDSAYQELQNKFQSDWSYNGSEKYKIAQIDEVDVILESIKHGLMRGQRIFCFMDLRAGLFQWGRHLAEILEAELARDEYLPYSGIDINIIGVSGELHKDEIETSEAMDAHSFAKFKYDAKKKAIADRESLLLTSTTLKENLAQRTETTRVLNGKTCTVYEFGNIKIEDLTTVLPPRLRECSKKWESISVNSMLDFVVSDFCFMHLKDGPGTLLQVINLLKDQGIICAHGFKPRIKGLVESNDPFIATLRNLGMPFVALPQNQHMRCFVLKREGTAPVELPLMYSEDSSGFLTLPSWQSLPQADRYHYLGDTAITVDEQGFRLWAALNSRKQAQFIEDNRHIFTKYRIDHHEFSFSMFDKGSLPKPASSLTLEATLPGIRFYAVKDDSKAPTPSGAQTSLSGAL